MLTTAKNHFDDDMSRALALLQHAEDLPPNTVSQQRLRNDIMRAAWMMSVGAIDAYFSDAYTDLIARVLTAKELQPQIELPDKITNLKVPVLSLIRGTSNAWRWRMVARELMEDENMLSLEKVQKLFHPFCRDGHKLISQETVEPWMRHNDASRRLFGVTGAEYLAKTPADKHASRRAAIEHLLSRFQAIFQRRHDCIHNCDRPRTRPKGITSASVRKVVHDIKFMVARCNEALSTEFPLYLSTCGFSATTCARAVQ